MSVTQLIDKYVPRQVAKGPRMRFGVIWFGVLCLAMVGGSLAIACVFAVTAALAAMQAAAQWRSRRVKVNQLLAGVMAGSLTVSAVWGNRWVALVLLFMTAAAVVLGPHRRLAGASRTRDALMSNLPIASATLRCGMFVGLAGAAVVRVEGLDSLSIVYLAALVSVSDAGNHLIGAGQRNRLVGLGAGLVGSMVVVLAMTAVYPQNLWSDGVVRWVGVATALACPLGQMLGTWVLPSAAAKAPALRRLDAWLVAAPVFLVGAAIGS